MPATSECGAGMSDRDWTPTKPADDNFPFVASAGDTVHLKEGDFTPGRIFPVLDGPSKAQRVMHIKIICPNCGVLLAHYKVTNPGVYLTLEVESCSECAHGDGDESAD